MDICILDEKKLRAGRDAFKRHLLLDASRQAKGSYYASLNDPISDKTLIFGAIYECIVSGLAFEDDIIPIVARVTRCRRETVWQILKAMAGLNPEIHLWRWDGCMYEVHRRPASRPITALTAA